MASEARHGVNGGAGDISAAWNDRHARGALGGGRVRPLHLLRMLVLARRLHDARSAIGTACRRARLTLPRRCCLRPRHAARWSDAPRSRRRLGVERGWVGASYIRAAYSSACRRYRCAVLACGCHCRRQRGGQRCKADRCCDGGIDRSTAAASARLGWQPMGARRCAAPLHLLARADLYRDCPGHSCRLPLPQAAHDGGVAHRRGAARL